ncbi:protein PHLOEM PROTEIN 2-LIKE A10-like [Phalaenopsis equestris]|uniref:protein PHLOEM PROTEIN 2-LIKE A10-like n=1 Tax=Phalaenopsis equestris TaxID=78828 RepID=UPI0009E21246|nr:protein PHLOEM PROTEIN 2-LIKE A10-like [Phalaenopsis equestris]
MDFCLRRKWILLLTGAAGLSTYFAYRMKIAKLAGTLFSLADAVSSTSDTASLISADVNRFVHSDSNEIPSSLKQLSKIASSDELAGSVSRILEALTVGIARGTRSAEQNVPGGRAGLSDLVLDRFFSSEGSNFASVVVRSFARNLVISFYSKGAEGGGRRNSPAGLGWVDVVCAEKCKELIAHSIQVFVSTAVAVFLDKTMHINPYDEFFAGITNPKHDARVNEVLVSVCNGAMETLVRTSHSVLTSPYSDLSENKVVNLGNARNSSFVSMNGEHNGWVSQISSALAVPSNKNFVLDVSGRVTFETVRSVTEFAMWKLSHCVKIGMSSIRQEVADRGLEVLRYVSARSTVIATICFILCMHIYAGTRGLMRI